MRRAGLLSLTLATTLACGTPDRGAEYGRAFNAAEAAETAGRFGEAAARYDEAADGAKIPRDGWHARYLAARALARSGDRADAAVRLKVIADASPPVEDSAEAAYAIAEMQIDRGDPTGWTASLGVARRFPSSGIARRALLRTLAHQDETEGPRATLGTLTSLEPALASTELAETVGYETALRLATLGEDARARDAFVAVATHWPYPHGVFWDDSLYRASLLDEKLGRYTEAVTDLTRMLGERESSWLVGSYERPRFEPAMVRLCALYRDHFHDRAMARACFERLYTDFTHSELRDDALWEESRLSRDAGDAAGACRDLSRMVREFPDSRYTACAVAECPPLASELRDAGAPGDCHPYLTRFRLGAEAQP
ncbi:MAG TPA: hypothetical protein VGI39_14670 [Polyangiaceae bacterium]|jgi:tetratricopeptide (TPR) repeat protein